MKAINRKASVILLCAVLAACSGGSSSQSAAGSGASSESDFKSVELKFATHWGAAHEASTILQGWADRVGELTGGKVVVTMYPAESLLTAANMYDGLVNGVADVVVSDTGYALTNFPLLSASYVSGIPYKNSTVATYAINEFFTKSDFPENKKVKMLFVYGMSPYCLISKKPIHVLEDFKGKQIRSTGSMLKAVTALGGTPVGLTIAETYEGLLKGTAEGVVVPLEALEGWKFGEVCKNVSIAPVISTGHHYTAMNKDVWDSFPADIQAKVEQANSESMERFAPLWDKFDESARQYGLKNGVQFYTVPQKELDRWIAALRPLEAAWIKDTAAKGLPAEEALKKIKDLCDKYNAIYGK